MVIFLEWHLTSLDPKSSGLPMTSEGTGLEASASPLAGYLEKVQARASALENCPWCSAKGFTYALRSYHVNFQESITLCSNPHCLFPLVSRSLEDVLASLDPVASSAGAKRKTTLEEEELIKPAAKRLRSTPQDIANAPVGTEQNGAAEGQHAAPQIDYQKINGSQRECPVSDTAERKSQVNDTDAKKDTISGAYEGGLALNACSASSGVLQTDEGLQASASPHCGAMALSKSDLSSPEVLDRCNGQGSGESLITNEHMNSANSSPPLNQHENTSPEQESEIGEIAMCEEIKPEGKGLSRVALTESEELASVSSQLFWKNRDNLCWLDSLLVALVNCRSLRNCKPQDEPQQSSVWRLIKGYEDIRVAVQAHHQTESDGAARVPNHVLQKANEDLHGLRMSVFKALEPKLHCKLGQRETPVFAMPLLLSMDSWAERLFQSAFHWEFKCGACRAATKERVSKTISTCTNLMPDWRPLHAVHTAPCNVCRSKNQKRTMKLVRVPPVFALHFVEGLPHGDVDTYSFDFKGKHYSVTTVIQYDQRLKHFVTWIRHSDGSWLEYDDLKHPNCKAHENLQVPPKQLHVLFWEVEESKDSSSCSPSSTFVESSPSESQKVTVLNGRDSGADDPADFAPDQSLFATHNDTDIVCALSMSDTTVTAEGDTSIGANTLLNAFEGLSHSDIVTLTLVDLNVQSETESRDSQQPPEVSVSSKSEAVTTSADTSSAALGGEKCQNADVEVHTSTNSSETESEDGSLSDPTYTPSARRGQTQVATRSRQKAVQARKAPAAAAAAPPSRASKKTSVTVKAAVPAPAPQNNTTRVEIKRQESTTQKPVRPKLEPNTQLSYLLSKNPLSRVQKSTAEPTKSSAQRRPAPPVHSTPSTVKRLQTPAALLHPKAQLSTEDAAGLPPKAAEMYGAFGSKGSNSHYASQPPHPLTSNHLAPVGMSTTSCPTHEGSLKKKPSDLLPALGSTDALRLKLLKKLKAKKKKLAKLNKLLGIRGEASLQPDSTDLGSPSTVTSSTHDGSTYDDFLLDLLSPATTASNLSPDSTEFLEMLASGKDGAEQADRATPALPANGGMNTSNPENFLEEFLSKAATQTPTDMEAEALGALELFL